MGARKAPKAREIVVMEPRHESQGLGPGETGTLVAVAEISCSTPGP